MRQPWHRHRVLAPCPGAIIGRGVGLVGPGGAQIMHCTARGDEQVAGAGVRLEYVKAITLVRHRQRDNTIARHDRFEGFEKSDEIRNVLDHVARDQKVKTAMQGGGNRIGEGAAGPDEIDLLDPRGVDAHGRIFRAQACRVRMIHHAGVPAIAPRGDRGVAGADLDNPRGWAGIGQQPGEAIQCAGPQREMTGAPAYTVRARASRRSGVAIHAAARLVCQSVMVRVRVRGVVL